MPLTFKNRIALHYMLATAALLVAVYLMVFGVVRNQVYTDLDQTLRFEAAKHMKELVVRHDSIRFRNKGEWQEREHREVQVNPVFIQVTDLRGRLMDRSPNLNADQLPFDTAVPSAAAQHVLSSLETVLLLSFPVVLLVGFGSARLLAGRSIAPITEITATANRITRNNLTERISLPPRPDELHTLAQSINALLQRIEQAVAREKQFTADASHELRTPLAVLKGTLEVLVRKPRTAAEYVASIRLSIQEIDRLTQLADQLLLLARFDTPAAAPHRQELSVLSCVHDVLHRRRTDLAAKRIRVDVQDGEPLPITADPYLVDLILDNLLANAVKYSPADSTITVGLTPTAAGLRCTIADQGIGIRPDDLGRIFDPLYRSDALAHKDIGGTGLGLSIVAKACARLGIDLTVQSELGQGTTFTLLFPPG